MTLREYTLNRANNDTNLVSFTKYMKDLNAYFKFNINYDFIDYFNGLVYKDDQFCVNGEDLITYKVITINDSSKIGRCLSKFINKTDYITETIPANGNNGGRSKVIYWLKPITQILSTW